MIWRWVAPTTRIVAAAELVAGALLLARGPQCWEVVSGAPPDPPAAAASRILGGRYLLQGTIQQLWPTRLRRTWVAVDLLHAASMALLAAHRGPSRRPALVSGIAAALNGGLGWTRLRRHDLATGSTDDA
jgi:hypothetical protein